MAGVSLIAIIFLIILIIILLITFLLYKHYKNTGKNINDEKKWSKSAIIGFVLPFVLPLYIFLHNLLYLSQISKTNESLFNFLEQFIATSKSYNLLVWIILCGIAISVIGIVQTTKNQKIKGKMLSIAGLIIGIIFLFFWFLGTIRM